jgi:hypothetical protein
MSDDAGAMSTLQVGVIGGGSVVVGADVLAGAGVVGGGVLVVGASTLAAAVGALLATDRSSPSLQAAVANRAATATAITPHVL